MNTTLKSAILLSVFFLFGAASAKLFQVGPTRAYTAPSKVMNLVSDGDTVEIDAGLYSGDVGTWTKNNLVIRCPNGMAHLDAAGQNAGGKAIWVISGKNTYLENIEFSGCTVPDHNGAGIRQEGDNLELRHCYLHDNEDGILTDASPTSDILFEACEFARNGYGDGYSHNMYIGNIRTFTMRFCYSHHAIVGHCVKSRAMNNFIEYNRIMDEDTGSASYLINLPNGGFSIVLGNTMQKGVDAQNRTLVDYGSEGLTNPSKQLYVVNNTMVSTRPAGATFVSIASGTDTAEIINNLFAGVGTNFTGSAYPTGGNYSSQDISFFPFQDPVHFNYKVEDLIGIRGINPGQVGNYSLLPIKEYEHPLDSSARNDGPSPSVGAFAYVFNNVNNDKNIDNNSLHNFPNPFSERTTISVDGIEDGTPITINIYNPLGEKMLAKNLIPENAQIIFERGNLAAGVYYYEIVNAKGAGIATGKLVVL